MYNRTNKQARSIAQRLVAGTSLGLILASSGAASFAAFPAMAAEAKPAVAQVDELVVTGVRGAPRTVMDSPTPIDSFNAKDLEQSGRAGVLQALQTLAPSFNLPFRAGGGTSTVISTGGLRGLNPDQTLILVNGKRRHKTSLINIVSSLYNGSVPADLDMVSTAGIQRIEVLRDGAAAQYGSDAIAGVINIITKTASEGGYVNSSYAQNFDRSDGALYQGAANKGFKLGENGFINLAASYKDQRRSLRAYPVASTVQLYPLVNGQRDPREAFINRLITQNYGANPQRGINFEMDSGYDISPNVHAYLFGTASKRRSDLWWTYRAPNNVNTTPQIYPNGYAPTERIAETDYEFIGGFKGTASGWDWDVSTGVGRNKATLNTHGGENASLGPSSPTTFYVGFLESSQWLSNADITRSFDLGEDSKLQVSFGGQFLREGYQIGQGDAASYADGGYVYPSGPFAGQRPIPGAQATPGFRPADAVDVKRNSEAAYGELGWDVSKQFFVSAAVRYENYSDSSGDTVTGKVASRYAVTDWFSLRGAISTGFRAPSLAQEYYATTTSQFRTVLGVPNQLLLIKTLPVNTAYAKALGAQPLTPETSKNYSGGFTLQPLPGLDITVDAYRIDVDHRIAITSTLTGDAVDRILVANGLQPGLSAQFYTNAINTRTTGIDVVAVYRWDLGDWGNLRFNSGYNHGDTNITGIIPNPPQLAALGQNFPLFGRAAQGNITTSYPKTKVSLGANWQWNKLTVNLRSTRYGSFTTISDLVNGAVVPANDRFFGSKWITDLEVDYKVLSNVTVVVGANNMFNQYPDKNGQFNVNTGAGQFPGSSPFGFTGGSWYTRVQYDF